MQIITTNNLNEARKQADKLRKENRPFAILSQDDEFNRKALEIKGLSMLIINESYPQKDYMKQRASGLNEVLAKICADKNIAIGIQIQGIISKSDVEKAKSLARLRQNLMLCRKAHCKLVFTAETLLDRLALKSVLLVLGASTNQASESVKQDF